MSTSESVRRLHESGLGIFSDIGDLEQELSDLETSLHEQLSSSDSSISRIRSSVSRTPAQDTSPVGGAMPLDSATPPNQMFDELLDDEWSPVRSSPPQEVSTDLNITLASEPEQFCRKPEERGSGVVSTVLSICKRVYSDPTLRRVLAFLVWSIVIVLWIGVSELKEMSSAVRCSWFCMGFLMGSVFTYTVFSGSPAPATPHTATVTQPHAVAGSSSRRSRSACPVHGASRSRSRLAPSQSTSQTRSQGSVGSPTVGTDGQRVVARVGSEVPRSARPRLLPSTPAVTAPVTAPEEKSSGVSTDEQKGQQTPPQTQRSESAAQPQPRSPSQPSGKHAVLIAALAAVDQLDQKEQFASGYRGLRRLLQTFGWLSQAGFGPGREVEVVRLQSAQESKTARHLTQQVDAAVAQFTSSASQQIDPSVGASLQLGTHRATDGDAQQWIAHMSQVDPYCNSFAIAAKGGGVQASDTFGTLAVSRQFQQQRLSAPSVVPLSSGQGSVTAPVSILCAWRYMRACYHLAKETAAFSEDQRRRLYQEAYVYAVGLVEFFTLVERGEAVLSGENKEGGESKQDRTAHGHEVDSEEAVGTWSTETAECLKWVAIVLTEVGSFSGTRIKIQNGHKFAVLTKLAVTYHPQDPVLHHMLGRFGQALREISSIARTFAKAIFGDIPSVPNEDILRSLATAHELRPFWLMNKAYYLLELHKYEYLPLRDRVEGTSGLFGSGPDPTVGPQEKERLQQLRAMLRGWLTELRRCRREQRNVVLLAARRDAPRGLPLDPSLASFPDTLTEEDKKHIQMVEDAGIVV